MLVFADNSKFRDRGVPEDQLEYLGIVTSIKDSVVTDYKLADPNFKKIDIDKNIVTFSKVKAMDCVKIDSLLIRPSDAIERVNRQTTNDLRHSYTKFLNNAIGMEDFEKALAMSQRVASSIGIKFGLDTGDQYVVYNRTASQGFNIFNSHPLAVEAHTDADIIIMMGMFLKHNSLWRSSLDLHYRQFDYAKSFFRRDDESTATPFFAYELASVIPPPAAAAGGKRKCDAAAAAAVATSLNIVAARNLIRPDRTNTRCRHDYSTQYVRLSGGDNDRRHCVACFCSLFFMGNGNLTFKDMEGLQEWIDKANSGFYEERLAKHLDKLSKAECHREIDHDYKFWNLISSLDARRRRFLPSMDARLVFANANSFGKMLLILMHNNLVVTRKGRMDGRWFDVSYIGPNMWKFQITSCKEQTYEKPEELACIETLRRLPMSDEPILSRTIFKVFCRGETLSSANEIVADVSQTIKNMRMCLEERRFYFDEEGCLCSSAEVSDEVLVSLEVTGYKPNRAQNNTNSNRVSARVMRLLVSREGARAWKMGPDTVLFEDLSPKNPNASYGAMEKMTALNRVYYYDIETTGNKCTAENVIVTSICGSLCVGGEVDGGERTIFALAVGDASPEDLVEAIRQEYPEEGDMSIDYAPKRIYAFKTEYELLLAFSRYMNEAKPHTLCGWNSVNFDDPFIFYRMVHHLHHQKDIRRRLALATNNGLFNFEPFFKNGSLSESFFADVRAAAVEQDNRTFMEQKKMGGGDISAILGGCCKMLRLDMKEVCRKAFESLSEYNLNAVLKKVSKVGDKMALLKDPVGIEELLGYARLKTAKQQAPIHKYCSKDAYLVGVVDKSTNKGGEMRRLCYDSTLIESVVMANMPTPLCISDGAICRSMGKDRAVHRGNGIRKHSMGTDTKGGMVSKPMVNSVPLQTVDMSSLYPSCMCHDNLCTSTFVTHRQVINLRDREVMRLLAAAATDDDGPTVLEAVDRANAIVMDKYRPIDIVVKSWRIDATDTPPRTMLEKKLGVFWDQTKRDRKGREWCKNKPPCYSIEAAGMEYFPEYNCNLDLQRAANANDDMHINPSDLEYLVSALPVMALEDEGMVAHVTCGAYTTIEELLDLLEKDFDEKSDADIIKRLYSHVGTDPDPDWTVNYASERCTPNTKHQRRVVGLLDRIMRRVNAFDSSSDANLRKWSNRMINVGSFVRAWNAKKKILGGVIPGLQADYKASRTEMQRKVKIYADIDPKIVEFNKIGEKTTKLSMNAIYGCLALRANPTRKVVGCGKAVAKEGGVGGGTRHSPTANQITSVARCVFGNIACAIQQALPNAKQVYGDTDSVFCNHNVPGEGGKRDLFVRERDGRLVYRVDTVMKNKIAEFLPLLINATTKGIKFDAEREAGVPFMKIAHERLAFIDLLFAKKTYHMIHLKEGSTGSNAILACDDGSDSINNIATKIPCPDEYKGYVVAHNPSLILSAAARDDNLSKFLFKEGVTDEATLKKWFTSSEEWLELDADALYNMYVSTMIEVEKGGWIDWRTARPIEKGTVEHDRVTQANNSFVLYKKGMFVKKGLVASSKLKGLQSLIIRNLPEGLYDRSNEYRSGLGHHVKNCASFEANPMMTITSSRVNKYNSEGKQKLPNPMAMMLNNHLLPTKPIQVAEKFLTVPVVSSWAISGKHDVPNGYFNAKSVKWDPETMRGLVPGTTVKSLSVIPNTIKTILEMVKTDAKNIENIIEETVSSLITASSSTSGVAFKKRALCYNTGLLCSDTMVRRVMSDVKKDHKYEDDNYDVDDDDVDSGDGENEEQTDVAPQAEDEEEEEDGLSATAAAATSTSNRHIKYSTDCVRDRILRCMLYDTVIFNNPSCPVSPSPDLKELVTKKLNMDGRVYGQLEDLIDQLRTVKNLVVKKKKERISELDEMIAAVNIDFDTVADICAQRMVQHCKKCPVILPEGDGLSAFEKILDVFASKEKCTATCINATCQALDFVLLCTLALREIKKERGGFETQIMREAANGEYVKKSFGKHFNNKLDAVVLLVDEASSHLDRHGMDKLIRKHSYSVKTGQVYNPDDGRFFGGLLDRDAMVEKVLSEGGEAVDLPFVTGMYYREVVELAVSKLCKNKDLMALLG